MGYRGRRPPGRRSLIHAVAVRDPGERFSGEGEIETSPQEENVCILQPKVDTFQTLRIGGQNAGILRWHSAH